MQLIEIRIWMWYNYIHYNQIRFFFDRKGKNYGKRSKRTGTWKMPVPEKRRSISGTIYKSVWPTN